MGVDWTMDVSAAIHGRSRSRRVGPPVYHSTQYHGHKSKLYSAAYDFCGRKAYIGPISPRSHSVLSEKVVW